MLRSLTNTKPTVNKTDLDKLMQFTKDFGQEGWHPGHNEFVIFYMYNWFYHSFCTIEVLVLLDLWIILEVWKASSICDSDLFSKQILNFSKIFIIQMGLKKRGWIIYCSNEIIAFASEKQRRLLKCFRLLEIYCHAILFFRYRI